MVEASKELFLICVFIYKNTDQLENTIKSIYHQTYPVIDLVLSDDHSCNDREAQKEKLLSILAPYRSRFHHVSVNVNESNLGTVKHINKILQHTSGDFLCLLGSGDCLYHPKVLNTVADYFADHPDFQICFSKRQLNLNDSKSIILPPKRVIQTFRRNDKALLNICCRDTNYITTIGTFYRRDLFRDQGFFDERYILMEDAPYILKLLFRKVPIGFCDDITCIHEAGGVSNKKGRNDVLEADSLRTLAEIKYKRKNELGLFTRRVVTVKYLLRVERRLSSVLKSCILYPEAVIYLIYLVFMDWIKQKRYFRN